MAFTLTMRDNLEEIEQNYLVHPERQKLADLGFISSCMEDGLMPKDRKQLLRTVPKCFTGTEAIEWMLNHSRFTNCKTRRDAEILGETIREKGFFYSVPTSHSFQDKPTLFFRFLRDEPDSNVLNENFLCVIPPKLRPPDVSTHLLHQIINLYVHLEQNNFFVQEDNISSYSPKIYEFDVLVSELQLIDANDELTHEESLAFWINIYHTLEVHRVIRWRGVKLVKHLGSADSTFTYNIAGNYYSMANIETILLKDSKSTQTPSKTKKTNSLFPLHKFVPEINFVLNYGMYICPPMTVYYPASVHRQIQSIVSHFLEDNITVARDKGAVVVSSIVYNNWKDFGNSKKESIIYMCTSFLPQKLAKGIVSMLQGNSEYKVKMCPKKEADAPCLQFDHRLQSILK